MCFSVWHLFAFPFPLRPSPSFSFPTFLVCIRSISSRSSDDRGGRTCMTWESRPGRRRAGSRDWRRARWREGGRVGSDSRALTIQKREACSFSIYIRHLLSPSLCPAFSSSPPPSLPTSCRFVAPTTRTPSCPAATSTPSSSFRKVERTYKEQGGNKKGRGVVQEDGREQEIRAEECEDQAGKK